jgi:hypothetical protein
MTNSISTTIDTKPFSLTSIFTVAINAIMAKVRATIAAHVPEGYEDEEGFHYGRQ